MFRSTNGHILDAISHLLSQLFVTHLDVALLFLFLCYDDICFVITRLCARDYFGLYKIYHCEDCVPDINKCPLARWVTITDNSPDPTSAFKEVEILGLRLTKGKGDRLGRKEVFRERKHLQFHDCAGHKISSLNDKNNLDVPVF